MTNQQREQCQKYSRLIGETRIKFFEVVKAIDKLQAKLVGYLADKKRFEREWDAIAWPWFAKVVVSEFDTSNIAACTVQRTWRFENITFDHLPFVGWHGEINIQCAGAHRYDYHKKLSRIIIVNTKI